MTCENRDQRRKNHGDQATRTDGPIGPKRFFVYGRSDKWTDAHNVSVRCRRLVDGQNGSVADEAADVGEGLVQDMPGYAALHRTLNERHVDAFVTDMSGLAPTMILGLFGTCAVNEIEMWDMDGDLVTTDHIDAFVEVLRRRLDAGATVIDMMSSRNALG